MDYLFDSAYANMGIRPFSEFAQEYEENERIERSDEYQAYYIVKDVLSSFTNVERLSLRMALRHSSVLLDKKVRNAICRFYFKKNKKYMLIIDIKRSERKVFVTNPKDIYEYADKLRFAMMTYEYMTAHEAARVLKRSTLLMVKLCINGKIKGAQKVGVIWFIPRSTIEELSRKKIRVIHSV